MRSASRIGIVVAIWICAALVTASPSPACMESFLNSVHFRQSKADLGRLPRRAAISAYGEHESRPVKEEYSGDYAHFELSEPDSDPHTVRTRELAHLQALARDLRAADLARLRAVAAKWRSRTVAVAHTIGWTGNLRDVEEITALAANRRKPSPAFAGALNAYLGAMVAYEEERYGAALAQFRALSMATPTGPDTGVFRERALYQEASISHDLLAFGPALELYQRFLREFPRSEKRPAALIMAARCAILPATDEGRREKAGLAAIAALRRDYPGSRFVPAAIGLLARIDLLHERYGQALNRYFAVDDLDSVEQVCRSLGERAKRAAYARLFAAYLRRLPQVPNYKLYLESMSGIVRLKRRMSPTDAAYFSRALLSDPDTAGAYVYYRLNHTDEAAGDMARLERLAERIAGARAVHRLPALLRVQIAEIYYRRGRYPEALRWASAVLSEHPNNDRALFVRGAALHRLKRIPNASRAFETLLQRFPESGLRPAAREEAALLAERMGDWSRALSHYFALGYRQDVAYLLDIRMTPAQIEQYLSRPDANLVWYVDRPYENSPSSHAMRVRRRDLIAYSLGTRYLRMEKWDLAERWFRRTPKRLYDQCSADRKEWEYSDDKRKPCPEPLNTVHDLRLLHRALLGAHTDNARAVALFRYGSYYHNHSTLLLYNPALWQQAREVGFAYWWNDSVESGREKEIVRGYMYQHESMARSRQLCLLSAQRYPKSPVAAQALYRAACASRSLASYNTWWREENRRQNHWVEAVRLMRLVEWRYPKSSLTKEARKYAGVFAQERANWNR